MREEDLCFNSLKRKSSLLRIHYQIYRKISARPRKPENSTVVMLLTTMRQKMRLQVWRKHINLANNKYYPVKRILNFWRATLSLTLPLRNQKINKLWKKKMLSLNFYWHLKRLNHNLSLIRRPRKKLRMDLIVPWKDFQSNWPIFQNFKHLLTNLHKKLKMNILVQAVSVLPEAQINHYNRL